jgi:hypothetical protein
MAFELIPFPISIIFVIVFALVFIAVLWKLRKKGKFYTVLFRLSVIIEVALSFILLLSLII